MTTTTTLSDGVRAGLDSLTSLLRIYLLPVTISALAATMWLVVIVLVTEATGSALLVLALVALPGIALMVLSRTERHRWFEYALVWLLYFTALPVYGALLLIGGNTLVGARAWRRHHAHALQAETDWPSCDTPS